ncbi:MAG: response regulator [Ardenticatenaceae bacterium]
MTRPLALIIEDDEDLAEIFTEAVQLAGCETEVIQDGKEALEWLAVHLPDLVVLDLHLPNVGGKKILARIREDTRLDKTRVIVTTADARLGDSLRKEAQLVLIKPVSFSQLRALARRLLCL